MDPSRRIENWGLIRSVAESGQCFPCGAYTSLQLERVGVRKTRAGV